MSVEEHLDMGVMKDAPDCLNCGVCCIAIPQDVDVWCHLLKRDTERLGDDPNIKGDFLRTKKDPHFGTCCVYLVGVPGKAAACEIHDKRPAACRFFEAGCDECHKVRKIHGIE